MLPEEESTDLVIVDEAALCAAEGWEAEPINNPHPASAVVSEANTSREENVTSNRFKRRTKR